MVFREFFGVVLELACPSEAWCFAPPPPPGRIVFLGFQTTRWGVFWRGFGTSSSFRGMVFRPQEVIFSKLFYC